MVKIHHILLILLYLPLFGDILEGHYEGEILHYLCSHIVKDHPQDSAPPGVGQEQVVQPHGLGTGGEVWGIVGLMEEWWEEGTEWQWWKDGSRRGLEYFDRGLGLLMVVIFMSNVIFNNSTGK